MDNVAALAQSIQPKGNTLSSTSVVTPVPFLLKHSLREYQHIGLDWLVTMSERKLNGKKIILTYNYNYIMLMVMELSKIKVLQSYIYNCWFFVERLISS